MTDDEIERLQNECMRLEGLKDIDTCRKAVLDDLREFPFEWGMDRSEWIIVRKFLDAYEKDRK